MRLNLKLAHTSDLHLTSLERLPWKELCNKRIIGYLSWRLRRRRTLSVKMLDTTLSDVSNHAPDHLLISGDLTQLGTRGECAQVKSWLQNLFTPDYISIVPGNHDAYVRADFDSTIGQWLPWMKTEMEDCEWYFPYIRLRSPVAIIGLSTARPSPPFHATGKLGESQLTRLRQLLDATARSGMYRVIMLHHGLQSGLYGHRRRLVDANALLGVLGKHGAELIVHGHGHEEQHNLLTVNQYSIPVMGVPSAAACSNEPKKRAGYNIYDVSKTPGGWLTHVQSYSYQISTKQFVKTFSKVFETARPELPAAATAN